MVASAAARFATPIPSLIAPCHVDIREWYVSAGEGEAIGPVSTELVARGIVAGKVPRTAFVARVGDTSWQDVLDVPEIVGALKGL